MEFALSTRRRMLPYEDHVRQAMAECRNPTKAESSHLRRAEGMSKPSGIWIGDAIEATASAAFWHLPLDLRETAYSASALE